ncbi:MAG TPA: hypothetical protein VEW42_02895 [Candidatus Eisenbacteria bacterium]|nr:hypothetical protein [Candidatus Eisenbacteria bacterium]
MPIDSSGEGAKPTNPQKGISPREYAFPRLPNTYIQPTNRQIESRTVQMQPSTEAFPRIKRVREIAQQDPALHSRIASNPFDRAATAEIERIALEASGQRATEVGTAQELANVGFTQDELFDTMTAILLEEPAGAYDENFFHLSRKEQTATLQNEVLTAAAMTMDLTEEVAGHMDKYMHYPPEEMYQHLCDVAFQTHDYNEIQKKFSWKQRQGYRIAILNLIRDRERIKTVYEGMPPDFDGIQKRSTKEQAAFLMGKDPNEFSDTVRVRPTPIGFVVEVDGATYDRVGGSIYELGSYYPRALPNQPPVAWGMVMLVATSDPNAVYNEKFQYMQHIKRSRREIATTRQHEESHAAFEKYHAIGSVNSWSAEMAQRYPSLSPQQPVREQQPISPDMIMDDRLSGVDRGFDSFTSRVLDESLAYLSADHITPEFLGETQLLGDSSLRRYILDIKADLEAQTIISNAQKRQIWESALTQYYNLSHTLTQSLPLVSAVLANGRVPDIAGRKTKGAPPIGPFLRALMANDGPRPFIKLVRDSQPLLKQPLSVILHSQEASRQERANEFAFRLMEIANRINLHIPIPEQEMKILAREMAGLPLLQEPSLLVGALGWIEANGTQQGASALVTNQALVKVRDYIFLFQGNPDALDDKRLQNIKSSLAKLSTKGTATEEQYRIMGEIMQAVDMIESIRSTPSFVAWP